MERDALISKDPQVCDPESLKTRDLERLIIGTQHGVANTVVYLKNITSGKAMDLPEPRRFPAPWMVEETAACFIVRDNGGQQLAYDYFEDEPAGDPLPNYLRAMRHGAWRRTSPSCRSCRVGRRR